MSLSKAKLAPRVVTAAAATGLGVWERSEAVNERSVSTWFICGFGSPVLAAQVSVPLIFLGSESLGPTDEPVFGWALILLGAIIGLASVIAAVILLRVAFGLARRGKLLAHCYKDGIVLERSTGRVFAATYSTISAELLAFENSSDTSGTRSAPWLQPLVILTLPDGSTCAINQPRGHDLATLLAKRCGAPAHRRRITVADAVELSEQHDWV